MNRSVKTMIGLALAVLGAGACEGQGDEMDPARVAETVEAAAARADQVAGVDRGFAGGAGGEVGVSSGGGLWAVVPEGRLEINPANHERAGAAVTIGKLQVSGRFAARRTDDGGAQSFAILAGGTDGTTTWQLGLPADVRGAVTEAGEVIFFKASEHTVVTLDVGIARPWAIDAAGASLPTRYELVGDTLVQRVDTTNAVFPVVADPRLTFGFGVYLNMTGAEIRAVGTAIAAAGGAAAVAVCSWPIGGVANLVCRAVGAHALRAVFNAIASIHRNVNPSACYQAKIAGPGTLYRWTSVRHQGNCRP